MPFDYFITNCLNVFLRHQEIGRETNSVEGSADGTPFRNPTQTIPGGFYWEGLKRFANFLSQLADDGIKATEHSAAGGLSKLIAADSGFFNI